MNTHNNISNENMKFQYKSRNLPHMFDVEKPVFITYRLNFTIPKAVAEEYERRIKEWTEEIAKLPEEDKKLKLNDKNARSFAWFDELIAKSDEVPQLLHKEGFREIIEESFKHFDGIRYKLLCYCIMSNHVHVLISPLLQDDGKIFSIPHIVYTWKKYTAAAINKLMESKGNLWQKEIYDRLVRDEKELGRVVEYILNNPVKAGLVAQWWQWKGNYVHSELGLQGEADLIV